MSDNFVLATGVDTLAENENRAFDLNGVSVLICKTVDDIYAVENMCTHQLQPLEGGRIRGCFIFCPLHGQRFDLIDGSPIGALTKNRYGFFRSKLKMKKFMLIWALNLP